MAILIFLFLRKFLIVAPNNAQQEMQGKLTADESNTRNKIEISRLSSLGKNKETAVIQIIHALGFTN